MARIFIAIRFNDAFKTSLVGIQNTLKENGVSGDFCSYGLSAKLYGRCYAGFNF